MSLSKEEIVAAVEEMSVEDAQAVIGAIKSNLKKRTTTPKAPKIVGFKVGDTVKIKDGAKGVAKIHQGKTFAVNKIANNHLWLNGPDSKDLWPLAQDCELVVEQVAEVAAE